MVALQVPGRIPRRGPLPLTFKQHLPGLGFLGGGFCPHGYFRAPKHEIFIISFDSQICRISSTVTSNKLESYYFWHISFVLLLINCHFQNCDVLLTWHFQMKHLFSVMPCFLSLSLSCVSARSCSACRDGNYWSSEGHLCCPHRTRPARSRMESHAGHPHLHRQGLTLHILGCEWAQVLKTHNCSLSPARWAQMILRFQMIRSHELFT